MVTKLSTLNFETLTYTSPVAVALAYHLKKEEDDNYIDYYLLNLHAEVNMRLNNNRSMVETMEHAVDFPIRNEALNYFKGQVARLDYVVFLIMQAHDKLNLQREVKKRLVKSITKG